MKRSRKNKKLKLTNTAKIIFSLIIIGIVLCSLVFFHKEKSLEFEVHEIEEKPNYTLKIDYPELTNKNIEKEVTSYITSQKEEFLATAEELKEVTSTKFDLSITYSLEDLFTYKVLHVSVYSYTGGAHYNKENKSYYYDPKTGEIITLEHFLEDNKLADLSNLAYYYTIKYYKDQTR